MAVYSLKSVQVMPVSLTDAWSFFSNPKNLPAITPAEIGFKIISKHHGDTMYAGQLIEYTVSPVFGIPLYWMTEITHVQHEKYFVDEQRYGPYSMWHHQHHFRQVNGGVEMTDIVHYKIPFWFFGDIANKLFVAKKLAAIFEYRRGKILELFVSKKG
jgi:ligand-binding SRPBCC domain-containing protein